MSFSEVELQVHEGRLVVRVHRPGTEDWEVVPTENWHCENGELVGKPPLPESAEGHAVMHVDGRVVLSRATNAALVVHVQSKESGVSMIVPFSEASEAWFQYPAIGSREAPINR